MNGLFISAHCSRLHSLDRNEKMREVLRILVTAVHFTDRNYIYKIVYFSSQLNFI